jgi:hypothetical protein
MGPYAAVEVGSFKIQQANESGGGCSEEHFGEVPSL